MSGSTVFTDRNGVGRTVRVTVGLLGKVKRETGFDLSRALTTDADLTELLFADPSRLVSVLYVLTGQTGDPEAFADLFDGQLIEAATESLLHAIADFFPRSRVAAAIREKLSQRLDNLDNKIVEALNGSAGS